MHILFGMGFDHKLPEKPQTRLGYTCTGPAGLLSILETQLGLVQPSVSSVTRLVQYQACLKELDSNNRFYHRSFKVDAVSVSRTLLDWRDQWYQAGWTGAVETDAEPRLKDMADVEAIARNNVSASFGERLQAVIKMLTARKTRIEEVATVDMREDLPALWQQVLAKLPVNELNIESWPPSGRPNTDLFILQNRLVALNQGESMEVEMHRLTGDGSVLVLNARSRNASSHLLAKYLKIGNRSQSVAVVTGKFGVLFDEALETAGQPRSGFQNMSAKRPPFQVLPLVLALLWEPLDPALLLQFLTHPVGPLPARVRNALAPAVVQAPGIGSVVWQDRLDHIITKEKRQYKINAKDINTLQTDINYWLHPQRFSPDEGIPSVILAERCARTAGWLGQRMGMAPDSPVRQLYANARTQASDLAAALESLARQGTESVSKQQLDRLLDQAVGGGSPIPDKPAEASHVCASDTQAAFVDPFEEIVWWDLSMPELPAPYPWSSKERSDLKKQGAHIQVLDDILRKLAREWLRPVMAAQERLVFVRHESDESHHPLWDQVAACCSGWQELDVESHIQSGGLIPHLGVAGQTISHRPLPGLKRWWQLEDGRYLKRRKTESYTSLDKFIKSPYQWVLAHKAGLYRGGFDELAIDNRLRGALIHRLFEDFFAAGKNWKKFNARQITAWIKDAVGPLLEQEGALLLVPGKTMERERFTELATRALVSLVDHFKRMGIRKIRMEDYQKGRFGGGELHGYIDMLLEDRSGRESILDVKWHGLSYRSKELENNTPLQLAVYAGLRKQVSGSDRWPAQAFYIIDEAQIITQNRSVFPDALIFQPEDGEDAEDLWRQFETTWKWRRRQLDTGLIEITVSGTEPDESSEAPENGMTLEPFNDWFSDYATLTGWEKDA